MISLNIEPQDVDDDLAFIRKKRIEADDSFNFTIKGKIATSGASTEWTAKFDRSLEYLMFPSLQLLPDEEQERRIIPESPNSRHGSPNGRAVKVKGTRGGVNSSPISKERKRMQDNLQKVRKISI